ncbi:clathrin heavy chain 2-like [Babylonia areolata]|uniref:clathrin heavy chain 2-like n=1 Tax=Babylonia areolata TaxID=304850 RepID=UPI003FD60B01
MLPSPTTHPHPVSLSHTIHRQSHGEEEDGMGIGSERGPPITINELVQLAHIGVPREQVTWSRVTLTSDKWISVRHDSREELANRRATVTVLSPKEGTISYAGQTSADSVLMNPTQPIIALKAGFRFEIFNLDTKTLIGRTHLHEPVSFWTWLNSDIVAIVTDTAVFHWDMWQASNINSTAERVFSRHHRLAFSEIVSYKADPSVKWLAITGLIPEDDRISGVTQLYSVDEDITQCISAHAVCFSHYQFADNPHPSTVFCVSSRDSQHHGKVHVIELGPYKPGNFAPRNVYDHIHFLDDMERYDFPISLQVSTEYGLLFVVTKYGYLYMCDMETAMCLCCTRISVDIIFTTSLNTDTQGILGVTRGGQVITVDLKKDGFISYLRETTKKSGSANRLEKAICQ